MCPQDDACELLHMHSFLPETDCIGWIKNWKLSLSAQAVLELHSIVKHAKCRPVIYRPARILNAYISLNSNVKDTKFYTVVRNNSTNSVACLGMTHRWYPMHMLSPAQIKGGLMGQWKTSPKIKLHGLICPHRILNKSFRIHFEWFKRIHFRLILPTLGFLEAMGASMNMFYKKGWVISLINLHLLTEN